MPANLTPQFYAAEEAYRKAGSPEGKLEALKEMLSTIPKHKGTEKLQADIKSRMARVKEEGKKKKQAKTFNPFNIEKQGAGQVVLVGYPNTGKSALVDAITRATVKVADYPYTTTIPQAAMMPYEDTYVQVVDSPPILVDMVPPNYMGTIREADALLIVIDGSADDCLEQLEGTLELLQEKQVIDLSEEGEIIAPMPFIIVATKFDVTGAPDNLELLRELKPNINILEVSVHGENLEKLRKELFLILDVIRVYGKASGRQADTDRPFVLKRGSNVLDFAGSIHKDFPAKLKGALVWGSAKYDGQQVAREYELHDGDIVELII